MDKIEIANFDCIDIANFWMHVKKIPSKTPFSLAHGQCWEWQGALFLSGYGHFICHQLSYRAHRVAYYLLNGTIPNNYFICHKCDNRKCCNPKHLFAGTAKENSDDRDRKGRYVKPGRKTKRPVYLSKRACDSRFFGVFFRKDNKKWRVRYILNGSKIYIGQFLDEIEAAKAYDSAIRIENESLKDSDKFPLNFP